MLVQSYKTNEFIKYFETTVHEEKNTLDNRRKLFKKRFFTALKVSKSRQV